MINRNKLLKVLSVIMLLVFMFSVAVFAENEAEGNEPQEPDVVETQLTVTEPVTEKPVETITEKPTIANPTVTANNTTQPTTTKKTTEPLVVASKSSNANLDSLIVKGITDKDYVLELELDPGFSFDKKAYKIEVPASVVSIEIEAVAVDRNASVSIPEKLDLAEGDNIFKIVVTAEDGTKKTYEINAFLLAAENTTELSTAETTAEVATIPVISQTENDSTMNTYTKLGIVFGIGGVVLLGISVYLFIKKKDIKDTESKDVKNTDGE